MNPVVELVMDLGDGNPGAMSVLMQGINKYGLKFWNLVYDAGLKGSAIWVRYKDVCGEDIEAMYKNLGGKE